MKRLIYTYQFSGSISRFSCMGQFTCSSNYFSVGVACDENWPDSKLCSPATDFYKSGSFSSAQFIKLSQISLINRLV